MKKKELDILKTVFQRYPEIKLVYFFGSRAKRSCGPLSDYNVLQQGLNDIEVFLKIISKKLNITRVEKKTGEKN